MASALRLPRDWIEKWVYRLKDESGLTCTEKRLAELSVSTRINGMAARSHFFVALALMPCLLAGCGPPSDGELAGESVNSPKVFSDDDKRTAKVLSIGSVQSISETGNPYAQALLCNVALTAIADELSAKGILVGDQVAIMSKAQEHYARIADELGTADGKSAKQIADDRQLEAEKNPDLAQLGQIGIGCLRKLV